MNIMRLALIPIILYILNFEAFAATPQEVEMECERQMSAGICFTRIARSSILSTKTIVISGAGKVSYSAYLDYIDKFDINRPYDFTMCKMGLSYMTNAPSSDHAKIARAMWTPIPLKN